MSRVNLTEFLLARIGEDEETARTMAQIFGGVDRHSGLGSPARVLAECESKRRIVEHHTPDRGGEEFPLCAICTEVGPEAQGWPCLTLRALALPYASHPDYQQEWTP